MFENWDRAKSMLFRISERESFFHYFVANLP